MNQKYAQVHSAWTSESDALIENAVERVLQESGIKTKLRRKKGMPKKVEREYLQIAESLGREWEEGHAQDAQDDNTETDV